MVRSPSLTDWLVSLASFELGGPKVSHVSARRGLCVAYLGGQDSTTGLHLTNLSILRAVIASRQKAHSLSLLAMHFWWLCNRVIERRLGDRSSWDNGKDDFGKVCRARSTHESWVDFAFTHFDSADVMDSALLKKRKTINRREKSVVNSNVSLNKPKEMNGNFRAESLN